MKSCISTYSFHRLYSGDFTRFDAIDKTKALGCAGVEFVLDDNPPEGYTKEDYALALTEHAHKVGLEVPIYTTGADFSKDDLDAEVERLCAHIDIAAKCGIPLLRHDIAWGYPANFEGVKTYKAVIERVAPYVSKEEGVKSYLMWGMGNFGGVDEKCDVAVSRLLELIVHVHAKDVFTKSGMVYNPGRGYNRSRSGNFRRSTIFGHGDVPTFQILAAIKNSGYDGFVSLEFEGLETVEDGVTIGSENLNRMIRDLEG